MKSIRDFNVKNKRVLVRCDFNVPIDSYGNILDNFRIKKTLPTIQYLVEQKAKIILMSHLGEPNGEVVPALKLDKVKKSLEKLLGVAIIKTDDCVGQEVKKAVAMLKPGEMLLLENLRFHHGETDNDVAFAKQLAALGDMYINDAFSDSHRAHASIVGIPKYLRHGAGLLLESEIINLNKILKNPQKPLVAVVGGIKVKTKAAFIDNISRIADTVLVSGLIKQEIDKGDFNFQHPEKILGPADNFDAFDIDGTTIHAFQEKIFSAKTIVWNGPFGRFEDEQYKNGTLQLAKSIVKSGAFSVVGGGETIEFLDKERMLDKFSHVSTGGGAMLDYLSGEELPGIKALT